MTPDQRERFSNLLLTIPYHDEERRKDFEDFLGDPGIFEQEDLAYFAFRVISVGQGPVGEEMYHVHDMLMALDILIDKGFNPSSNLREIMGAELANVILPTGINNILELAAFFSEKEIFGRLIEIGILVDEECIKNLQDIIEYICSSGITHKRNSAGVLSEITPYEQMISPADFPIVYEENGSPIFSVGNADFCRKEDSPNFMNILIRRVNQALQEVGHPVCSFFDVGFIKENFLARVIENEENKNIFDSLSCDFNDLTNPALLPRFDLDIINEIKMAVIEDREAPAPEFVPVDGDHVAGGGVGHGGPGV